MTVIGTLGPQGGHAWQAAHGYAPGATIKLYPHVKAVFTAFASGEAELILVPVYNTREGEIKEFSRLMERVDNGHWIDNVVLPIHLSLGAIDAENPLGFLLGRSQVLRQCEEYIATHYPAAALLAVYDIDAAMREIRENRLFDRGIIEAEETLKQQGFHVRGREIAPYNRTRFAIIGRQIPEPSGYDATVIMTVPLKDRVGILFDILGEFSRRDINLLDMHSETDIKSQELQFYVELEGHIDDAKVREALTGIEVDVIREPDSIRVLGSFPRLDMRTKRIRSFGFIGSGDMSAWFAERLRGEGYETLITGRSSRVRPEEMIPQVDVVAVCVPISATPETVRQYGPLLRDDQALILLAGEAEGVIETALGCTGPGVEVLLVHNLWGPQAASMKDKNVVVVRTPRSGVLCSEFEAFLYKHGAKICQDDPVQHDLMMGVSQKLPTVISVALALALRQNGIPPGDIGSHSTLTSLYGILSMARMHAQNPRTYAEIMAAKGKGSRIVRHFIEHLGMVMDLADRGEIAELGRIIEQNRDYLTEEFLADRMRQSLAVDETLGRVIRRAGEARVKREG